MFLTRLGVVLNHLREGKFQYSFFDTLNPTFPYGSDIETLNLFSPHRPLFTKKIQILLPAHHLKH